MHAIVVWLAVNPIMSRFLPRSAERPIQGILLKGPEREITEKTAHDYYTPVRSWRATDDISAEMLLFRTTLNQRHDDVCY
jgi:hypothetical protein